MARIRTIKPEFFTSGDITSLPESIRLFYISTWLEADREGKFVFDEKTWKNRYFPADIAFSASEAKKLVEKQGLITFYNLENKTLGFIKSFSIHQVVNPKERASCLPFPTNEEVESRKEENPREPNEENLDRPEGMKGTKGTKGMKGTKGTEGTEGTEGTKP